MPDDELEQLWDAALKSAQSKPAPYLAGVMIEPAWGGVLKIELCMN